MAITAGSKVNLDRLCRSGLRGGAMLALALALADVARAEPPTPSADLAPTTVTAGSDTPANPDLWIKVGEFDARLQAQDGDIAQVQQELSTLRNETEGAILGWQVVLAIGAVGSVLGVGAMALFGRPWVRAFAEARVKAEVDRALESEIPKRLAALEAEARKNLLRTAQVLALHNYGAHDEALRVAGWNGQVASLRSENFAVRRALIEALYETKRERDASRDAAWEGLRELAAEDNSVDTARLYLRICCSAKKYSEGYSFFETLGPETRSDPEVGRRVATLLRRMRKLDEALALLRQYPSDDADARIAEASLLRDKGLFDEANSLLEPNVLDIVDNRREVRDVERRLLNTYVANLIDLRTVERGVRIAQHLLASGPGAVEVFTIARFTRHLEASNPARTAMVEQLDRDVTSLLPGEARVRADVQLKLIRGDKTAATEALTQALEPTNKWRALDRYYLTCTLADLLIDAGQVDSAIKQLMPLVGKETSDGEAEYRLAIAYDRKGAGSDAASWLSTAQKVLPKWYRVASINRDFQSLEVGQLLAQAARARLDG